MASERKKVVGESILKASMTSVHRESFSKIAPKVFGKFAIARSFFFMGTTIVVPIYAFVGAKRGVVLSVLGS